MEPCKLRWCKSGQEGTVEVSEIIGDGAFRTEICERCAKALGLKQEDDLPDSVQVEQALRREYGS